MNNFAYLMQDYRKQMEKGVINRAYQGLMGYLGSLRSSLQKKYPDYHLSTLYQGYLDMSYFSFTPLALKEKNLKIAIVFLHEAFRFEVWLAAANKRVQEKYWKMIRESRWEQYSLVLSTSGADAILEHTLVEDPNFGDLEQLSIAIETGTLTFIKDVAAFIADPKESPFK
jgi:hypothetical protein